MNAKDRQIARLRGRVGALKFIVRVQRAQMTRDYKRFKAIQAVIVKRFSKSRD